MSNFVITKGVDNEFTFTIKQTGTTLPMEIEVTDTFVATLVPLEKEGVISGMEYTMTTEDAVNGKIKLNIPEADTVDLVSDKGDKVDRYYNRPTYKLIVECDTVNNGNFTAKVPLVYVD